MSRPAPGCEVHVPISPTPAFFGGIRLLAASLRAYGGELADSRLVVTVSRDCEPYEIGPTLPWSSEYEIEWRWVDPDLFERFGIAATALQRFTYRFEAPRVLMLDGDVLCVGHLDELFEGRGIAGVTAWVSPQPQLTYEDGVERPLTAFWPELFEHAGLPAPPLECEHPGWSLLGHPPERRLSPPYFNLGVIAGTGEEIARIGAGIFDELARVNEFCTAVHRCQMAVTLAIFRTGSEWREVPLRFNFPNNPDYWEGYPGEAADVRIIHYVRPDEIDRDSFRAGPDQLREFLGRRDLSPVNALLQTRIAGLAEQLLGDGDAAPRVAGSHRLRFVQPQLPEPEEWLPFLEPAYRANWFSNHGPVLQRFERGLGERYATAGREFAVLSSATSGLVATLIALGVRGPVALPAFTFPATAHAIVLAGCTPVFCDVDPETWELDPAAAEAAVAGGCEAIIHVRAFGLCRDVAAIEAVADRAGVPLVLDSAAAFGGRCEGGAIVGGGGEAEVFSFHATKPFAVGEGGAVAAPPALAERIREVINFDLVGGEPVGPGLNGKMSEFTAAIGLAMLERFEGVLEARREAAGRLDELIVRDGRATGPARPGRPPWQCFPLTVADPGQRGEILETLSGHGMEARVLYHPALHRAAAFAEHARGTLPATDALSERILCLPVLPGATATDRALLDEALGAAFASPSRAASG